MNRQRIFRKTCSLMLALLTCLHAAASSPSLGPLSGQDCKAISRICYELSENEVGPFSQGRITNEALIDFGVLYNYNEQRKRCVMSNGDSSKGRLAAEFVAQAAAELFGKSIHNQSTKSFHYSGGNYRFWLGDPGNESPAEYQVRSCTRQSDGTYLVIVDYVNSENHRLSLGPRLILKRIVHNGATHFHVIAYQKEGNP